jgi:3-dehydroquinate dehydratase/shikimate dehydrogenase
LAQRASLIATLTDEPSARELEELGPGVDWLEVRGDLVRDLDPDWLRDRFGGRLLYTLRSRSEGGAFEGSLARRRQMLGAAAERYDRVDLEVSRDLVDNLLAVIPSDKRVLSWHGPAREVSSLRGLFRRVEATPAALYKFVPTAREAVDELSVLEFLSDLGRDDVLAFCTGESAAWTRYIAPYLGAPVLYGSLGARSGAPGQPTIQRLQLDYGFPELRPVSSLAGIVGNPVGHSLSPRLHNGAYRALGIPALYVPFQPEHFSDFWIEIVEGKLLEAIGMPLEALSITAPFKNLAVAVSGASSPLSRAIDSANTLVYKERVWQAESTDPSGVSEALRNHGLDLADTTGAVIGSGGAGRAAVAGLASAGCRVTLFNRTVETGREVADSLNVPFAPLSELEPGSFDVLINATSLGHLSDDALPFSVERLAPQAAVLDLVYGEEPTDLVQRTRARGSIAIDGREVLLHQAAAQFQLMTGRELPLGLGRELLGLEAAA